WFEQIFFITPAVEILFVIQWTIIPIRISGNRSWWPSCWVHCLPTTIEKFTKLGDDVDGGKPLKGGLTCLVCTQCFTTYFLNICFVVKDSGLLEYIIPVLIP